MAKQNPSEISNLKPKVRNSRPLRVLMVEDSEDDVMLITRELKKGGYNPVYERVETAAATKKALKEKQWDIILCDYKLPQFNAPSAIAVLKETNIDIPLIIVSGAIGEETAVECIRLGARDYIMKDNLSRLCHAIARELEQADSKSKRKQAESQREAALEVLRQSEERYRTILENIEEGYAEMDLRGNFIFFNQALCTIQGYPREEIIKKNYRDLMDEKNAKNIYQKYKKAYTTGESEKEVSYEIITKSGMRRYVETSITPMKDGAGRIVAFRGIVRDRTEHRQAEEILRQSEEKYRTMIEAIQDGYFETDLAGKYTFVNDVICQHRQYSREEFIGADNRKFQNEANAKKTYQAFAELYKTGKPINALDMESNKKDGTKMISELSVSLIRDAQGRPIGFRGLSRDISQRKEMEEMIRQSEVRYRTIIENIDDGYFEVDLAGNFTFVNEAQCKNLGYPHEELVGMNYRKYSTGKNATALYRLFNDLYKTRVPVKAYDLELIKKDGTKSLNEVSISLIINSSGEPAGFRGISRDVTQRRLAEQALRQSEERYRTILESIDNGYCEQDLAGNFTFLNDSMCRIYGYPKEELLGMNYRQYTDEESGEKCFQAYRTIYQTGEPGKVFDFEIIRKDGSKRYIESSVSLQKDSAGKSISFKGIVRDITDRKLAEEALRQSEERYRNILESIQEGYFELDLAGIYTFVNEANCRFLGYTKEELVGMNSRQHTDEENMKKLNHHYRELYQTGKPIERLEVESIRKDGTKMIYETSVSLIRDSEGKPIGYRGVSRNITERAQMEEKLRLSEERYRTILDEMEDAYFEVDLAGHFTFVNDADCRQLGYSREELIGANFRGQMIEEDIETVYNAYNNIYKTGQPERGICYKYIRKDGTMGFAETTSFPLRNPKGEIIGFRGVGHDITEKKKIQFQLLQSEKMASIGQLAAGVAHEINNPISFVKSNLKTLSEYLTDIVKILKLTRHLPETIEKENIIKSDLLNKLLEEINSLERAMKVDFIIDDLDSLIKESQEGTDRIIRIVRDLKTYAHPSEENLQMADVNANMESTLNIISNEIQSKADVYKEYGNIPKIYCHPQELNQVFMNILLNAAQAIKEKGEIRISTGSDPDGNIEIRIQDNGVGISEENLPKLFNPFYTTKDIGKGTGLGLHVAFSIIQKHEGKIEVESKPGVGTTFIVRMPAKHKMTQE